MQLLLNLKIAMGELSEVNGEDGIPIDLLSHLFNHYGNGKAATASLDTRHRAYIDAYTAGINAFYGTHPEDVPDFWRHHEVTSAMVDAFGRMFLYNWSIDEALEDLRRAGIEPGFVTANRGSNQWAISPHRTANGDAMLLIDPHLSWWGPSRFWEMRVHAGDWHGSGVGLAGSPYIGLGHNADVAWAMTTGGPDTADVYELQLNPDDPEQYLYDGAWRDIRSTEVTLDVARADARTYRLRFSHHGPIVATQGERAYAAKVPYTADTDRILAWEKLNFAKDYRGAMEACATLAMFPQNVMVADTSGNIYYQRTGRVPVRPDGYDWSRPVDGSTSASEWQGVHPASDHLQVVNPPQGYLQNCNIPPDAMIPDGPFSLDAQPDYLYSGPGYGPARAGWTNQRGARALELLSGDADVTVDEALAWAVDTRPYGLARWLDVLSRAVVDNAHVDAILAWDGRLTRDSAAALKYAYWRYQLEEHPGGAALRSAIDDHYALVSGRTPKTIELSEAQYEVIAQTFGAAMSRLTTELGDGAVWGDVYRVGRDDRSWPVGGGGGDRWGLTTLRSMGYGEPDDSFQRHGRHGQTSTQLVVLSKPIRSWIYLPVGQSDRPDSTHYDDQAEHLFSERRMKPSWWLPEDLAPNIESRTVLPYPSQTASR